jgi:nucleotide-binding universal stress UspA family protein
MVSNPTAGRNQEDLRMKMMVCFDGSNVAKDALQLARQHAKVFGGKIWVVSSMAGGRDVPRKVFEDREKELEYHKTQLEEAGFECDTALLVRGLEPGEDLVDYAAEKGIEEILIGVRRRSKVGKLLFGSTAQYVILNAPCPVVTVR